ncbi:uncharacterized protein LOC143459076 isoform X2 [Clavelina lepadiformis]|uniref:uncharacterized protein LOC143459076 isoform X2 n=1 Tax=Clavelina lepadiformis TaxID=159417 RepID=UPI004042A176
MDNISDSIEGEKVGQEAVEVPGCVDDDKLTPEGRNSPQMNRIHPDESSNHSRNNSLRHRVVMNSTMDENDVEVTSFTTSKEDQLLVGHTNPVVSDYEGTALNAKSPLKSASGGPTRIDSLQVAAEMRLETVDITEQSLHQVARDGNIMLMKAILKRMTPMRAKRKLNKKDRDKFTPLHYAARYNHFEMCELLLQYGANLHCRGEDDLTPLHLVAKYKPKKSRSESLGDYDESDAASDEDGRSQQEANVTVLEYLISTGAHANDKDFYGLTALHHASLRGNVACVKKLLECRGISIEATDKQQMTPLHIAAVYGHVDVAKILISSGANIVCKDDDNGTPLQFAAAEGNLEIVELILRQCEKYSHLNVLDMIDEKDNDGNTPLHLGVDNGHLNITKHIIERCLSYGHPSTLNCRRNNRETPLHLASRHGHFEIVKILLEKGAKLNCRDEGLQTPLMVASQFNHHNVVKFLIECGANIELHDADNFTALLLAASYGHAETISVLLENRANIMAVDKNDKSVIFQCAEDDRVDALQELLKHKKVKNLLDVPDRHDNTPLHAAADSGNITIVKMLLNAGATIDLKNEDEQTPLHLAAENGSVKIVKELVSRKKEIVHDDDEGANTPLHLAALSGRQHCVRELVRLGANIGARNAKQWTPLDCCASAGMYKSATVLLEADCPVDPKDKRKVTPLHLACQEGHKKMVELLLAWNADITHRAVHGRNALDFAIDHGQVECARTIIASDKWREALENRTRDILTDEMTQTPMRKLIRKMPSVAEDVFRKCMRDNGRHKDHPLYEISFDYEFLDDEFSCTQWYEMDDTTSEINIPVDGNVPVKSNYTEFSTEFGHFRLSDDHQNCGSDIHIRVYDDVGKVTENAEPYLKDSTMLMKNHPLYVMVKSRRVTLMRHPLVISLLNHKWRAYGRTVYYTNLLIYVIFMAVLNSYMLTVPPPFAINADESNDTCAVVRAEAQGIWGATCPPRYAEWRPIAGIIILALAIYSLVKEAYQLLTQRSSYFTNITNLVELSLYVLAILLVIDVTTFGSNTGIREAWQWQCGSAALFFSWIGLLLFIQNFPRFGIYVLMFSDVMKTFISFFAVFALFILGFAFSFHVLLQNQYAFNQWWNSIVKTFVMMIGEFDYDTIFNSEATSPIYTDQLQYEVITYLLFVTFMIIMSIIIMNLLVGLAVDDIKEVQDNAVLESLAMQVKLTLDVEYTLPQFLRRRFLQKYRKFSPNRYRRRHWLVRWLHSEEHLNHETIEEALNPEKTDLQLMEGKIDLLQTKVRDIRGQMRSLDDRSRQIETMTQSLVNHFKVKWEKQEDDVEGED